jgi:transcriptional regulator GlxA family with amidase domain
MLRETILLAAAAVSGGCDSGVAAAMGGPASIPAEEHARTIEAMRPPKRARPVVAVVAHNDGTETTDFIVPYGVLAGSGAAEVIAVAPEDRAIRLTPALAVEPQMTIAAFDARYPAGADYVVVPRLDKPEDETVVRWIQGQAGTGATIVGVCDGAKTVAAAGLLDGRAATGHWFTIGDLAKAHPTMRRVRDRRYVADRGVVTTTGVSASLPVSLALVEAIAGRERAAALAAELGAAAWDERHDSAAFRLDPAAKATGERNRALGQVDVWTVPVTAGVDEIALAFTADAWSRTFRSKALAVAAEQGTVRTRRGLVLVPDAGAAAGRLDRRLALDRSRPADSLRRALVAIGRRYGEDTASFVALQLEYAWHAR